MTDQVPKSSEKPWTSNHGGKWRLGSPSDQGLLWDKAEYSLRQLGIESQFL